MDATAEIIAEHGAVRALNVFYAGLDAPQYDVVVAGVASDGTWHRQGKALKGPAMVAAAMAERPKGARTRHVVTNMVATVRSDSLVELSYYLTVFAHQGEPDAPPPAPMNVPNLVALCQATMKREGSAWKIAELKSAAHFQRK